MCPLLCLSCLFCPPTVCLFNQLPPVFHRASLLLGLQGLHGKCARSSCTVVLFFCLDSMCSGSTAQFLLCPRSQAVTQYSPPWYSPPPNLALHRTSGQLWVFHFTCGIHIHVHIPFSVRSSDLGSPPPSSTFGIKTKKKRNINIILIYKKAQPAELIT